jgi:uncharacterized protein
MQAPPYRAALEEYIRAQAKPLDKFSHQPRLYRLAQELARGVEHDDDVLHAAAWMHDLGVFVGHRPEDPSALASWDCVGYAMRMAPVILAQLNFPPPKIPAVVEVIRTHQPASKPTCIEGVLLRDADMLEQLGAVSVLRTVSKVGRDTRFVRFSDALRVLRRSLEEMPSQFALERTRQLAQPKIQTLTLFLEAAEAEGNGIPW